MGSQPLSLVLVNTNDTRGGAAAVARRILELAQAGGHRAWLAVHQKRSNEPRVLRLLPAGGSRLEYRLKNVLELLEKWPAEGGNAGLRDAIIRRVRPEYYYNGQFERLLPGARQLLNLTPAAPQLIHFHNLHPPYFNLGTFPILSQKAPLVISMHDEWLLTGHCAYSIECQRWQVGCGNCPDLKRYPPVPRDGTAYNFQRRKKLFERAGVYLVTPSRWLMSRLEGSLMGSVAAGKQIIPNGINLSVFRPADQAQARRALGIPGGAFTVLFVGNRVKQSSFKDYATARRTFQLLAERRPHRQFRFICLGQEAPSEWIGQSEISYKYSYNPTEMARYYHSADVYLHTAIADTFPNSVLEAMACALPVVAAGVGGLCDQVIDGQTGFLAPAGDAPQMAHQIGLLMENPQQAAQMGQAAAGVARERYDQDRMFTDYLHWYGEVIKDWRQRQKRRTS